MWISEMAYKVKKSGIVGLVNSASFIEANINMDNLFKCDKFVYLNAYNMSGAKLERFINRVTNIKNMSQSAPTP
jgi:hypothetical protein